MKSKISIFLVALSLICIYGRAQTLQKINTIAGNGIGGFGGDGSDASGADLWGPIGVTVDPSGNMYIADHFNYRVRKVFTTGLITTIAGNGVSGNTGDGSIGSSAEVSPIGVITDRAGNVYISDQASHVIRKVNTLGIISTIAGVGFGGYSGNGGQATAAKLNNPAGMAFDATGNLYFADQGNHVVRKISTAGIISTVAGNDTMGFTGNGGLAIHATLDSPYAVAVDSHGDIFIADYGNNVIRMVDSVGVMHKYVGTTGAHGYTGDSGPDSLATMSGPRGLVVDASGNLYFSDANNNVVRKVDNTGIITTYAGNGTFGFGGDLGYATSANLFNPYGLALDAYGSLYIADANNERIRKVYDPTLAVRAVAAASAAVSVFPNPACTDLFISGQTIGDVLMVTDLSGRMLYTITAATNATLTLPVQQLAAGMYLLHIQHANQQAEVVKWIKE